MSIFDYSYSLKKLECHKNHKRNKSDRYSSSLVRALPYEDPVHFWIRVVNFQLTKWLHWIRSQYISCPLSIHNRHPSWRSWDRRDQIWVPCWLYRECLLSFWSIEATNETLLVYKWRRSSTRILETTTRLTSWFR